MNTLSRTMRPEEALSAQRLDVFGKIPFARSMIMGTSDSWSRELYFNCLLAMKPLGNFDEDGIKFTLNDYEEAFRTVVESLSRNGFDPLQSSVPLDRYGIAWNGAHRLAAALALDIPQVFASDTGEIPQVYDFHFFLRSGMPDVYLSELAWQFCLHMPDTRAIVLSNFETEDSQNLVRTLRKSVQLVYSKTVKLTPIGQRRLMDLCYGHLPWFSSAVAEKLKLERFSGPGSNEALLVLYELPDGVTERELKESLRGTLSSGEFERRIHGTDDWDETLSLAEVWTNWNSLHFLNHGQIEAEKRVLRHINAQQFPQESWTKTCFDGGAVLEMYGIRRTQDLDHLCHSHEDSILALGDCHNSEYSALAISPQNVVFDPRLHFRWSGFKFSALDVQLSRLVRTGNDKSKRDLSVILNFLREGEGAHHMNAEFEALRLRWIRKSKRQLLLEKLLSRLPKKLRNTIARIAANVRSYKSA